MKRIAAATVVALVAMVSARVSAHHSAAPHYDLEKKIELKGTVTQFKFVNPHAYVFFDVTEADGKKTPWRCELAAATVLSRLGWGLDIFPMKEPITIKGSPARREENVCMLTSFIRSDGVEITREADLAKLYANRPAPKKAVATAARPARATDGHLNLAGLWIAGGRGGGPRGGGGGRPGAPGDAAAGAAPGARRGGGAGRPGGPGGPGGGGANLTDAGAEASKLYDGKFDNPALKCQPENIFFAWTHDNHVNEIIQTKNTITLKYGYMDVVRTIHMNAAHPAKITPSNLGHSTGQWDGDTLVVDTVGFAPGLLIIPSGTLHSNQLHSVERFTLDSATMMLTRTYTAEDPLYLKAPYSGQDVMKVSDEAAAPYGCVELSGKNNIRIK